MSEYNHGRMREWMQKESQVKDQYSRKAYFLVNWQELSVIQCCYDDTQTPNTVWIRRAWFAPKACLLYTSPSPRDRQKSRMPSSA